MQWTDVTTLGSRSLWLFLARRAANGSRVEVRHRADMLPQHLGKLTLRRFDGGALSCQNEAMRAHQGPLATFTCANGLTDMFEWRRDRLAAARRRLIEMDYIIQIQKLHEVSKHWPVRSSGCAQR
jgi:hypothetical protein